MTLSMKSEKAKKREKAKKLEKVKLGDEKGEKLS